MNAQPDEMPERRRAVTIGEGRAATVRRRAEQWTGELRKVDEANGAAAAEGTVRSVPRAENYAPGRKTTKPTPEPDALDADAEVDILDVLARGGRLSMTDGRPRVVVEVRCMKLEHDDHVRKPD
jgi:hypothetical protein